MNRLSRPHTCLTQTIPKPRFGARFPQNFARGRRADPAHGADRRRSVRILSELEEPQLPPRAAAGATLAVGIAYELLPGVNAG